MTISNISYLMKIKTSIYGLFNWQLAVNTLISRDLAIIGFLLLPSLYYGSTDPLLLMTSPLIKPAYTTHGLYKFTLQELLDLTLNKVTPVIIRDKPRLIIHNTYWLKISFTFSQAFPLLKVYSEPRQGFTEVIQAVYCAILAAKDYQNVCVKFNIAGTIFYLYKIETDYLVVSEQTPTTWSSWFPFQLTWLIQHLWYVLHTPEPLQLVWWWFGQPVSLVRPPTWTSTTDLQTYRGEELTSWSTEKKVFVYLLDQLMNLPEPKRQEEQIFLQKILNLYLKHIETGPGYTRVLNEATYPVYSIQQGKRSLFWQGYVGPTSVSEKDEQPKEQPHQIWERFKQLSKGRITITVQRRVIKWNNS